MVVSRNLVECWYLKPVEAVLQISAVVTTGVAEGLSHVNLRKVYVITWWWVGSLVPICLITAALMAQGMAMAGWGVCACVLLVSKSTTQHTAAKLDKDTAVDRSKGPCRRAHGCALDCAFGP